MNYFNQSWLNTTLILFFSFLMTNFSFANDENSNPWSEISEREFAYKEMQRPIIPKKYRTFKLDMAALQNQLADAPLRFSNEADEQSVILHLPLPNGELGRFEIYDAPIMEPALASKFPMIHSYAGVGIDDPTASLRFDVTQFGFHALILSARHGSIYIDPYSKADTEHYITYYKKDYEKIGNNFECHLHTEMNDVDGPDMMDDLDVGALTQGDCELRTYRLALSCTGEYATFHGGTVNGVIAAMNTTMTRVNGIFERDFNVNMVLVNGNENLIFLDAANDPYDDNSTSQLINESHAQCNAIIGNANYDIGHVFSTGGGGLAGLGVVCNSGNKGRGVTGTNSPIGDSFDVDYVCHEMGHQFGANHTFNNSCSGNRNGSTAVEPGSGSTIMSYAGICNPNVQFNSDDYFHAMSIQEVTTFIAGNGNSCANTTNTGNNAPTVQGGADYVLPISTPFKLTANGSDADGDVINYCWEQMDNEIENMPPVGSSVGGPLFRSAPPVEVPHRYFPKLEDIVNGVNSDWEELPSVSRTMNFRVTVRDLHQGGGCTDGDDVQLTFTNDAGPFLVQYPNQMDTWYVGSNQQVTWDVANTNNAPVNCANVNVLLSTDGGMTYPEVLAESIPNNGAATITVPNNVGTNCRVMVVCADNIFFDISDNSFSIEMPSQPTFIMSVDPQVQDVCGSAGLAEYGIDLTGFAGFNETVTLSAVGLPTNATESYTQNNFVPNGTSSLSIGNLANVAEGEYFISLVASSASLTIEQGITLIVNNSLPDATALSFPANGSDNQVLDVDLGWGDISNATSYQVEIATSPEFGLFTVETATVNNNTFTPTNLENLTVYYWRVVSHNNCGETVPQQWYSFQTGGSGCQVYESADIPVIIPNSAAGTITSTLNIAESRMITSVKPTVEISHSWVGDLKTTLKSPWGDNKVLFDKVGVPDSDYGCNGDNLLLSFSDNATNTAADLEGSCGAGNYSLQGTYQSVDPLSTLNNLNAQGDWVLEVQDFINEDGGALEAWSLEVCYNQAPGEFSSFSKNVLMLNAGSTETITTNHLEATSANYPAEDIRYVIRELPLHGTLSVFGVPAAVGTVFSQKDINDNLLTYTNVNLTATNDVFAVDITSPDGAWLQDEIFEIVITQSGISANAYVGEPVSCFGGSDGSVVVQASGVNPPFTFSLNGGPFQSSELFENLPAGTYSLEIKDNLGETITTQVVLENPEQLQATHVVTDNQITITATGGTGTILYKLNGEALQTSNIFENVPVGTHTVYVVDVNDCLVTIENIVIDAQMITASVIVESPVTCHNGSDGMLFVQVSGGVPPLFFSLNNNGSFQSDEIFQNLTPGVYTVTIKDSQGNQIITDPVTLDNPLEIVATPTVDGNTITVDASGGIGNFTYAIVGGVSQSSNIFEGLNLGTYSIIVTDANGCTFEINDIVVDAISISGQAVIESNISCHNGSDGMVFVVASGGVGNLTYSLNGGAFQTDALFENLPAGTYSVTVKDSNGSTFLTNNIVLENPDAIVANTQVVGNVVTINAQGGTGMLTYNINGSNYSTNNVFADMPNGTFMFGVQDENGCITEVSATVNIVNDIAVVIENTLCHDEQNGSLTIESVSGGQPNYLYSIDGGNFSASTVFNNLGTGNYTIFVMDASGFVVSFAGYMVQNAPALSVTALTNDNTITATGLGGTGALMYSIDGVDFQTSNVFENLPNGTYVVTVIDENECSETTDEILIDITSIFDLKFDISFDLYPNPNHGQFTIELNQPTEKNLNLQIFDVAGKLVTEINFDKNQMYFKEEIQLPNLAAGTYEVLLTDGEMFGQKRFTVSK